MFYTATDNNSSDTSSEHVLTNPDSNQKSVLDDVESLKGFLSTHPDARDVFKHDSLYKPKFRRNVAVRVAVQKLVEEQGLYPSRKDKIRLSEVLGELCDQLPCDFFNVSNGGYISSALKTYRLKNIPDFRNCYEQNIEIADKDSPFSGRFCFYL